MALTARELLLGTGHVERGRLQPWHAARAGVINALLVLVSVLTGNASYALPLAVGALFVCFVDAGDRLARRYRTMLWTATWITLMTLVGGLTSNRVVLGLITCVIVSLCTGMAGALGPRGALVGVLSLVAYVVFDGAPVTDVTAVEYAACVAAGALIMIIVTIVPAWIREGRWPTAEPEVPVLTRLRGQFTLDNDFVRHAVRLTILMSIATVFADISSWPHDYWIPMTIAWVTKPDKDGTATKIIARISGTIAGLVIALLLVDVIRIDPVTVALVEGAASALTMLFLWANYAIAVSGITLLVVGLFTFDGDPVGQTFIFRIVATLIAGAMSFLGFYIWPPARRR